MKSLKTRESTIQYSSIIWIVLCVLVVSSCSKRPYYTAKSTHMMTLNGEGDIAAAVVADTDIMDTNPVKNEHQFSLQAAYSPLQNLAVSSNCNLIFPKSRDTVYRKGFDYDFAIGTYANFDYFPNKRGTDGETILLEAYLTFGQGRFSNVQNSSISRSINYNRYGAQFGLHYQSIAGVYYSVGLVYRPSILKYSKMNLIGNVSMSDFDLVKSLENNNRQYINEISFNLKFGAEKILIFVNCYTLHETGKRKLSLTANHGVQLGLMFNIDAWLDSGVKVN